MPDARVQAAVDHWGPRFIQAGVDANDFARTTARIETWEEWLGAWCETAEQHVALAGEAEAAGRVVTAGEAWLRAAVCFHFAKFVWVVDEARSRDAADRAVAALREAHRLLDPAAERVEAPLDGATVVANLRRPLGAERPPLVLLIAGLDSTKEEFFLLENLFHARGMATLSLDGPGQGEGGYELPLRHDFEAGVTAILDAVDGFDADRRPGRQPRRLLRAAGGDLRAADQRGGRDQRAVLLRRDLGPPAAADARDVRAQVARRRRRGRPPRRL